MYHQCMYISLHVFISTPLIDLVCFTSQLYIDNYKLVAYPTNKCVELPEMNKIFPSEDMPEINF